MSSRVIVIVGTGTEVGKTHVGLVLLGAAMRRGVPLRGCKPVETGVTAGGDCDGTRLLGAGTPFHVQHPPLRYRASVAPPVAARLEGRRVELDEAISHARAVAATGPTLVETAGGLFSPLGDDATTCWDVACALDPACWILVAADRLGVLHELNATLGWARARGRAPDLVVLSPPERPDASTTTNAAEISALGMGSPVVVPRAPPHDPASDAVGALLLARAGCL